MERARKRAYILRIVSHTNDAKRVISKGGTMEKFTIGLVLGGIGGALLTANNYKMRTLVKKSQEEVQKKLDGFMDDKITAMESAVEKPVAESDGKSKKKNK